MDQAVDVKIIKAISQVRLRAGTLSKDSFNPHGRYNYVPIDTYYEKIVPLACEAGLIWRCRETGWEMFSVTTDKGDRQYIRGTYHFDLYADDAGVSDYMKITVVSALTGPQTAGQMFSYADKVFMRVTFSVATGESDGDDLAPADAIRLTGADPVTGEVHASRVPDPVVGVSTAPAPALIGGYTKAGPDEPIIDSRAVSTPQIDTILSIFQTFLPKVPSSARLHDWYAENLAAIEKIGKIDQAAHAEIKRMFNSRNTELKEKKEASHD